MSAVQSPPASSTARRLQRLAELYQHGQASEVTNRALDKVLAYEASLCRKQLDQIRADLADLEQRYGMASDDFFRQFQAGETDDRMDFVEWASLAQMARHLEDRLRALADEGEE